MQIVKYILLPLLSLALVQQADAQIDVLELHIKKGYESPSANPETKAVLWIPIDTTREFFRWDPNATGITSFTDNTGKDLLAESRALDDKKVEEGYSREYLEKEIRDGRWVQGGVTLEVMVKALPAPSADKLSIKADVLLEYRSDELEEHKLTLKVPTDNTWREGGDGETFYLNPRGTVTMPDAGKFHLFDLGSDLPIATFELEGGDDRAALEGSGYNPPETQLVFKDTPESVTLTIKTAGTETEMVPVEVEMDVGL